MTFHYRLFLFCLLFLDFLPPLAAARMMMLDSPTRLLFSGFASALAVVGDIDGDTIPDYLVGAYDHPWNKNDHQGRAFVFSGRSGKLLFTIENPAPQREAAFGYAVAAAGDVDKDGVPDLLIGAFGQDGSGKAFVFSGKEGRLLFTLQAPRSQSGAGFGWSVASAGDLTHDGFPELLVGAFAQEGAGRAFIFDGHTGKLLRTLAPPSSSSEAAFGWSVSTPGDIDNDGIPDIVVGAPYSTADAIPLQGRVYVFSGRDGKLLFTLADPQPRAGAVFGWSVAPAGDFNKDGATDILVGAPYKDVGKNPSQGAAFIFSGKDGKLLASLQDPFPRPYAVFGYTVAQGPDVNQDGAAEILVGAPYQTVDQFHVQGEVFLFNGQDGRHLTTFDDPYPHQGAAFGYTLASPGDVNGDKIPDFAFGAAGQHVMDQVAVGRVFVFLSQP